MNKIIDFLQSLSENENIPENSIDKGNLSNSFNDIKDEIASIKVKENKILQLKSRPKAEKGQVWLCKQQYFDALGNQIIGNFPYLVFVVSGVNKFANENFIRIQPITPFTEFSANDEILIKDDSIVGFDFIIETWNEQPILTELLAEFVGNLDIGALNIDKTKVNLTEVQKEFRKSEIRNTAYLSQSIKSLIEFEELREEKTVFLNIGNSIHFPKSVDKETKTISLINDSKQDYSLAAKKGKLKDRPTSLFEKKIDGVEIKIKVVKDNEKYILAIKQPKIVELKDINGKVIKQNTPNLYDELTGGLYFIGINGIKQEIRIRLK
ncbi:hypothetical protein [Maribellus mangrovi]|uniref:hypothetical protein n=1 Tax=Maribellus mangrovi TaxID=3133146 RepID=UPI0030EC9BC2